MLIKKIRTKEIEPFLFLHGEKTASYDKIPSTGQKIMNALNRYIQKHEVAVLGPPVWSYGPLREKLRLKAGFPVKKGTRGTAPFAARTVPAWKSVSAEFRGPMDHMVEAWVEFLAVPEKKGISFGGDRREIYRTWVGFESEDNVTELQIRLKK